MDIRQPWHYGETVPYFDVITYDAFRKENLGDEAKTAFFESGEKRVESIFAVVQARRMFGSPRQAIPDSRWYGVVLYFLSKQLDVTNYH